MSERAAIRKMHRYSEESAQRPKANKPPPRVERGLSFLYTDGFEGFIIEALMTIFKASV